MRVRPMQPGDLEVVQALSLELGYPVTLEAVAAAFAPLAASAGDALLVAERDGAVIGWAHVQARWLLESGRQAELVALVVSAQARRSGAGRALVAAAAAWARAQGLARLRVRSNVARVEAHRFYPALGFERVKTSHLYELSLG